MLASRWKGPGLNLRLGHENFFKSPSKFLDYLPRQQSISESESELFTGDTSKDNHSPGPVFREVSP